jgi:hypothetical protein
VSLPGITGMHGLVGAVASNPSGAFDPSSLFGGTAGGMWDPSDKSTMFKDTAGTTPVTADGDIVARINDKSGNGNHLIQATLANRPMFKDSGGLRWLQMDDSTGVMTMAVDFAAPFGSGTWSRVSGLRSLADGMFGHFYADHGTGSTDICLHNNSPPNQLFMYNGSSQAATVNYGSSDGRVVVTELWANPAPCQLGVDNGAYSSSPSAAGVAPRGFVLGVSNAGAAHQTFEFYGGMMIARAITSSEQAQLKTWYGTKVGKTL